MCTLRFLGLLLASPCLSSGIPDGGWVCRICPHLSIHCDFSSRSILWLLLLYWIAVSGNSMEDGASSEHMAGVCVWRGVWGMDGKLHSLSGIVRRGRAFWGDDAKAQLARRGCGPGQSWAHLLKGEVEWATWLGPAIYRESRIQGFPQAAQILKTANYSFCSFLSLGLFMHLKWAVKGILCIRQSFALKEAGWNKAPSH